MRFNISHHEVKRKNMIYYVTCKVQFTEQERAIIRTRNLYENCLIFESGAVDYSEEKEELIEPWFLYSGAGVLGVVGLAAATASFPLSLPFFAGAGVAGYMGVRRDFGRELPNFHDVTIRRLIENGQFTVCGFNDPLAPQKIERDIRQNMELLKSILNQTSRFPGEHEYEV